MVKKHIFAILFLTGSILITACGKLETEEKNQDSSQAVITEIPTASVEENKETPKPTTASFSLKEGYGDVHREISILGLKEYKKIKGEKYTDKASKGKTYLVLFLRIHNISWEKDYFHPDYLTTKVDGKEIENTFLLNEPEGYPTVFDNIEAGSVFGGFVVWEVPVNWKKLNICYTGWEGMDGLTLDASLTKDDLKNPEKYSSNIFR